MSSIVRHYSSCFPNVPISQMFLFLTISHLSTTFAASRHEKSSVWHIPVAGGTVPWRDRSLSTWRTFQHQRLNWAAKSRMRLCKMSPVLIPKGKANSCSISLPGYKVRRKTAALGILAGQGPSHWGRPHGHTTRHPYKLCSSKSSSAHRRLLLAADCSVCDSQLRTWPRPPAGRPCPPGAGAVTVACSPSPALP